MSIYIEMKPIPLSDLSNNLGVPKKVPAGLHSILANINPEESNSDNQYVGERIKPGKNKIYLGQAAFDPESTTRYPFWLPVELLSSHLFIGGAIGSGKTTVLFRLIAGALKCYGTVIVCEAKGGVNGAKEGASFSDLSDYLNRKDQSIRYYRWPRGNCYFNPLANLVNRQDRRDFFSMIAQLIIDSNGLDGETASVVHNAANISECLLNLIQEFTHKPPTIRILLSFLTYPEKVQQCISEAKEELKSRQKNNSDRSDKLLTYIETQLTMSNFFFLKEPQLVLTRRGVQLFRDALNHEDLMEYSEERSDLKLLDLNDILFNRSLVVLSQPISKSSSLIIGPLFLDNLLFRILEFGPNNQHAEKPREKVLAILDETHRLPVGSLGLAGDFLREYDVGLVEVAPTIPVNQSRWEQNKHIYQTLLSLSPGIPELTSLIHDRLPNQSISPLTSRMHRNNTGVAKLEIERREDYNFLLGTENPGIAKRSLEITGVFTGILQSALLQENRKVFWIDFEDEILGNIKNLLKHALLSNATSNDQNIVDYALGLSEYNSA